MVQWTGLLSTESLSIGTFCDPLSSVMSIDRLRPQHIIQARVCWSTWVESYYHRQRLLMDRACTIFCGRQLLSMNTFIDLLWPAMAIDIPGMHLSIYCDRQWLSKYMLLNLLWPAMAIDRYISNILWPATAIDRHRWESLVCGGQCLSMDPITRLVPHLQCTLIHEARGTFCAAAMPYFHLVITTSMELVHGVSWWAAMWVHGIASRGVATLCVSTR